MQNTRFKSHIASYAARLSTALTSFDWTVVDALAEDLIDCWIRRSNVWLIGNGGSGANAIHWANDFLYPIAKEKPYGIRMHALTANGSVVTCLGNDIGYENVFARQLKTNASKGDLLIALSGSGNSPNILKALTAARELEVKSYALLGFCGGKAKELVDVAIHFPIDDMQVAEDLQMVVCHGLVQTLSKVDISELR